MIAYSDGFLLSECMLILWIAPVLPDYADVQAALKHRTSVSRSSAENFLSDGNSTHSIDILCRSSESLDMDTVIHWGRDDNLRYKGELLMSRPQSSPFEIGQKSQGLSRRAHMSMGMSCEIKVVVITETGFYETWCLVVCDI